MTATILRFVDLFFTLALFAVYIFLVLRYIKHLGLHRKKLAHSEILISILASGMCSPAHRTLYTKLKDMTPDEAIAVSKDDGEFFRMMTSESFIQTRKILEEALATAPSEKKTEYQSAIEELDAMFNLLSSVDKNSSTEHKKKIMQEVDMTMARLHDKGIILGMEGMGPIPARSSRSSCSTMAKSRTLS